MAIGLGSEGSEVTLGFIPFSKTLLKGSVGLAEVAERPAALSTIPGLLVPQGTFDGMPASDAVLRVHQGPFALNIHPSSRSGEPRLGHQR